MKIFSLDAELPKLFIVFLFICNVLMINVGIVLILFCISFCKL